MSGGIAAGNIVEKVPPVYPVQAKLQHLQGSVVMAAVISRTGTIENLEVIASPALSLSEAATDAVKRWKYKPYLLNGSPVDVDTTIIVNFSFGTGLRP
jgi:protein TonB